MVRDQTRDVGQVFLVDSEFAREDLLARKGLGTLRVGAAYGGVGGGWVGESLKEPGDGGLRLTRRHSLLQRAKNEFFCFCCHHFVDFVIKM